MQQSGQRVIHGIGVPALCQALGAQLVESCFRQPMDNENYLKEGSRQFYLSSVRTFFRTIATLGIYRYAEITLPDVTRCLAKISETFPLGIFNLTGSMRSFARFMAEKHPELPDISPALVFSAAKRRRVYVGYTHEDAQKIFSAINRSSTMGMRDYAMIMLAYTTGLRGCDIVNLKFDSIDWDACELRLVQEKTNIPVSLPLDTKTGNAIADYILHARPKCKSEYIFLRVLRPYTKIGSMWTVIAKYAHIALGKDRKMNGPHAFRRGMGRQLLEANIPAPLICDILGHSSSVSLEKVRNCSRQTQLQRLAAIRSFVRYGGIVDLRVIAIQADVERIRYRKPPPALVGYLTKEELSIFLAQPNCKKRTGFRNMVFLVLMYDTAARCQEMLDLRIQDLVLHRTSPCVYFTGKGNKTRVVPILPKTAEHLRSYLKKFHPAENRKRDDYVFYAYGGPQRPMSPDTVAAFVKKYGESARHVCTSIPERVHPHMLRHTRAMHLYQDGVPLAMVSEFLGHAQIETTKIYAHADTEMKRKAIQQAANKLNDTIPDALWNTDDEEMMLKLRGKQQYK